MIHRKMSYAILLVYLIMALSVVGCSKQKDNESNMLETTIPNKINISDIESATGNAPEKSVSSNELNYYISDIRRFSDGVAWVETSNKENGENELRQWACIDTNGDVLFFLDPNIYKPGNFENGVSLYEIYDNKYDVESYNIIDKSGNIVFSSQDGLFDEVIVHDCGYFAVCRYIESFNDTGYKLFFLNPRGDVTLEVDQLFEKTPELVNCGEGVFAQRVSQNAAGEVTYRFYDAVSGKQYEIGGIDYWDEVSNIFHNGYAVIEGPRMGDEPRLVSTDGEVKTLDCFGYGSFYNFGPVSDGGVVCTSYDQKGVEAVLFYDIATETVTQLGDYGERVNLYRAEGLYFDNGYLLLPLVGADGKNYYTILDKTGESLVEPVVCKNAYAVKEDRIVVEYEDKTVVINGKNEIIFELPVGCGLTLYYNGFAELSCGEFPTKNTYIDREGNELFDSNILLVIEN